MRPCSRRSWMLVGVLVVVLCSLLLMPWGGSGAIAAKGAAAKKAPTVVKELTDKRTADSETFLLSNGSMRSDLYAKPIHYKDAKGVWQNIDTTLVPDTHPGEFVSRATPVSVTVQSAGAPTVSLGYLGKTLTLSLNGGGGSLSLPAAPAGAQPGSTTSTTLTSAALASPHNVLVGDALTRLAADTAVTYQMTADSLAGSSSTTDSSTSDSSTTSTDASTTTTASSTTTSQAATTDTTQATTTSLAQPLGDTVTFTGVSGDTDLSCQVAPDGVKENLVLSSASAPDTFTFTLSHPGLILRQDERGQWGFYTTEEDPDPVLILEAPLVYDSSKDSLGDPAYCDGASMSVVPGTDQSTVTYSIPESWLTDPARVYPVTLDPSVNQSANPDTLIDQGYPNTPYSGLDHMSAGNFGSPDNWTTGLLQFALPEDLNNGAVVQSADLYLHQYYQSTSTAEVARISAMTKDWSASDTYSSLGSTSWFGSQTVSVATTTAQTQTLDFPVKSIVQEWADNALPNYGFTLYQNQADSQSGRNWYRRVYSNEAAQANRPVLSITYTLPYNVQTAYHADGIASDYHDDTTAFQTAINDASAAGGGTVYVPAGTYYVKDTLTLSGSNVKLLGAGTNSIIQSFSETDSPPKAQAQLITLGGSSASSNLSIQSLNLRVPKAGNAIRITGSASITGVHIVGNIFSGGADSSSTSVVSCDATNFSDLDISGNDLSLVTCVPFTFASQTGSRSIFQNTMPATKPYTSDGVVGSDGYDAAIRESNFDYANPTSTVVLVTGQNYSLGASAAVLAGAYGGPVLLTHESSLDTSTQTEIERLGPSTVYVVGLSSTIATQAGDSLPNCTVVNETGSNDNATAATIATTVKNKLGMPNTVLIIPSDDSAVGTAVAAEAAAKGYPVLLTPAAGPLPSETSGWYQANVTNSILEVGTSVSLPGLTTQTRVVINGTDDYDTANQYASNAVTYWNSTYAYTGLASAASGDWQYSVGAGASLGKHNGVMLLANGQTPSTQAASALAAHCAQIQHLVYLNEYLPYQTDQVISPWMPSAPQHTIYGLREFADHNASATLDTRALSVQTTDLTVASFGPDASLSRIYSSTNTSATYFAPGWRFDFEQKLTFPANQETDYTNPLGDVQKFIYGSGVWTAASGYSGRLTYNAGPPVTWSLAFPEGDTLTFDANGHLMSDADSNGNTTTYTWTNGYVTTITAANGQTISLTLNGGNRVATYATSAGTRTVTYSQAAPWTVAYSYSGGTSTPSRSLTYGYTSSLLTGVTASAFTSAGDSIEGFSYTGTDLTGVTYPDYASNADSCVGISYGSQTATVTTKGTVYNPSTKTDAAGTAVTQTYTWNASGTTASQTNPQANSDPTQTWTYTYAPYTNYELSETSPRAETKSWTYTNRGDLATSTDELGTTTLYSHPNTDPGIPHHLEVKVCWDPDDATNAQGASPALQVDGYGFEAIGHGNYVDSGGWVFRNIPIPQGSSVSSATIKLYAQTAATGNPNNLVTQLGLAKVPQIWSWDSTGENPATEPLTTNVSTTWHPTWTKDTWVTSPNIAAAVQEVTGQSGWASGNNLAVIWKDNGTQATNVVDAGSFYVGEPAVLDIDYLLSPDPSRDQAAATSVVPAGGNTIAETSAGYDSAGNLTTVSASMSSTQSSVSVTSMGSATITGSPTEKGARLGTWQAVTPDLLSSPSDLTSAAWTKSHLGAIANQAQNPQDGAATADKLSEDNANASHYTQAAGSVLQGTTYSWSAYVKAAGRSQVAVQFTNASGAFSPGYAVFDLSTGTVLSGPTTADAGMALVKDGWYYIWASQPALATVNGVVQVMPALSGALTYQGTGQATPTPTDPGILIYSAYLGEAAVTTNSNFSSNGAPGTTIQKNVTLQSGGTGAQPTTNATYDALGNLLTQTDSSNQTIETATYDLAGRLLTSTGPSFTATSGSNSYTTQVVTHHVYDAWGHETETYEMSTADSANTKADWVTNTYDKFGRVSEAKRWLFSSPPPSGTPQSTVDTTYDGLGQTLTTDDTTVSGLAARTEYDAQGHAVISWAEGACSGSYDLNQATSHLNADNTAAYDAAGNELVTTGPGIDSAHSAGSSTFSYTADNRALRSTESDGTWTENTYDYAGNVVATKSSTSGGNNLTTATYDTAGDLTSSTNGDGLTTTYTYDDAGNQLTAGVPGQTASQFTDNNQGAPLKIQDPDGFTTSRAYDQTARILSEANAGYTTANTYQSLSGGGVGLLQYTTNVGGPTRYEQTDSRITKTGTWSDFSKAEASAGSYGRSSTSGATASITFTGTRLDWIAMTGTTPGIVDVYLDGTLKATIDLYSATAQYQVDAWSSGYLPDGSHTVQLVRDSQSQSGEYIVLDAFDVWGRADGQTTYTYDFFGNTTSDVETTAGTTLKNTLTTYDSLGRVDQATDSVRNLSHTFTYPQNTAATTADAQGVGSVGSDLVTTNLSIGADRQESSRTSTITSSPQVPTLTRTVAGRDYAKRVTSATLATGSATLYAQYSYDSAGRLQYQWGTNNGGSGYASGAQGAAAYSYDQTSGLKTGDNLQLASVGTAGTISSTYDYTANGRLAHATTNGNTETDQFDPSGNIQSTGATAYNYQSGTNLLSSSATGGQNTYYFFDPTGKWRTVQAPTNSQTDPNRIAFTYTGTGRLATWTKYASGSPSVTGTYVYDATGQRTQSVVAVNGGLTTTTNFTYEGLALRALSASQSGTGATSWKITYLYDENGQPYAGIYRNPATSTAPVVFGMVTTDRGDVVELLDVYGQPFAAYRYDAWGNPQGTGNVGNGIWSQQTTTNGGQTVVISASIATDIANRQVLRYAGYCWDAESGLYYLSARSYDPVTRQFISKDLARSDGEGSAYSYCEGAPVTECDPTGLEEQVIEGQYKSAQGTNMGIKYINDYIYHAYGPCKRLKQKTLGLESFTQDQLQLWTGGNTRVDNCGTTSDTRILKYWSWSQSKIPRDDIKIYKHVMACNGKNYYVANLYESTLLLVSAKTYGISWASASTFAPDPLSTLEPEIDSGRPCGLNISPMAAGWADYKDHTVTVAGYGQYQSTQNAKVYTYICVYDGHRTNMMYIDSYYSIWGKFEAGTSVTTLQM